LFFISIAYSYIVLSPSLALSPFSSFPILLQLSFHLPCNISLSIPTVCLESYLLFLITFDVFPNATQCPSSFFRCYSMFSQKSFAILVISQSFPNIPHSFLMLFGTLHHLPITTQCPLPSFENNNNNISSSLAFFSMLPNTQVTSPSHYLACFYITLLPNVPHHPLNTS